MRIDEIIARADSLEPNQYTVADKLYWINQLDGKLFQEVILSHYDVPERFVEQREHEPPLFVWKPYESTDCEPIAEPPYGMDVYVYYLQAMVAQSNMENAKYNARMAAFNAAYRDYAAWYNRTHRPRLPMGGNRLRF